MAQHQQLEHQQQLLTEMVERQRVVLEQLARENQGQKLVVANNTASVLNTIKVVENNSNDDENNTNDDDDDDDDSDDDGGDDSDDEGVPQRRQHQDSSVFDSNTPKADDDNDDNNNNNNNGWSQIASRGAKNKRKPLSSNQNASSSNNTATTSSSSSSSKLSQFAHINKPTFALPSNAKFFIIKSINEDNVHKSIKYKVWTSTKSGNQHLSKAWKSAKLTGNRVFLFFSVNKTGRFCGVCEMMTDVDWDTDTSKQKKISFFKYIFNFVSIFVNALNNKAVWTDLRWKGQFQVKWLYVKGIFENIVLFLIQKLMFCLKYK